MKPFKQMCSIIGISLLILGTFYPNTIIAETTIEFTQEEQDLISRTQNGGPIHLGILPHTFPLSECPPAVSDYTGTNVEMVNLISKKTGLRFSFGRISLEEKTPYQALLDQDFNLVAGTIKLDSFLENPNLILSNRLDDGSVICISKRDGNPSILKTGKLAVLNGYQAGIEFSKKQFPDHELVGYDTNQEVMEAVRTGKADLSLISRYVGTYELQSPLNESLSIISPYQVVIDSCVMGLNTSENKLAISIINKGLAQISESEYNHILMNFSITHPYELSTTEYLYKNRYVFIGGGMAFLLLFILTTKLISSQKDRKMLSRDPLTNAYSEAGFELAVSKMITKGNLSLFITEFDLSNFSMYNELHGKAQGDELLKSIVQTVGTFLSDQDIICRSYADNFKTLSSKKSIDELISEIRQANLIFNKMVDSKMTFNYGIYPITDPTIPISKMLDFASIARKNIKRKSDENIGVFDASQYEQHLHEMNMLEKFEQAIAHREFVAYYQPKFDAKSKAIIGAEALVRWIDEKGSILMPGSFVELFEKNGLIQKLDFYMLETVCIFQKRMKDAGKEMLPISVNFSRIHLFTSDFVDKIKKVVETYDIPKHLIEIECTETAITEDADLAKDILKKLRKEGFEIAMDDFGKGYSSLNALSMMDLDIVKLDSGFLSTNIGTEKEKANKVIASIVTLVHGLSLKVTAEGVETKEQYEFLKDVGCDYIQGFYFSKPLPEELFIKKIEE